MRTATFETSGKIEYPDAVALVFNPMRISVTTTNKVNVNIANLFTDSRTPFAGKVELDISSYCQALFEVDGKSLVQSKSVEVRVFTDAASMTFSVTCIWGAINIGERFNAPRVVTWFTHFPFTFSLYVAEGATVRTRYDKNGYTVKKLNSGLNHLDVKSIFPAAKNFGVIRLDETILASVFEYTFDNTFTPVGPGVLINRIIIDDSKCGVYLRWIDRHGMYYYYLFKDGANERKTAVDGEQIHIDYQDNKYGYHGVSRYQQKPMQRSTKACAVLVDANTIGYLETLLSSPLVDMWVDGNWVPVTIAPASMVDERKSLQDFEIEIMWPEIVTQRL